MPAREKKLYSREFLGVKLVRLDSHARKAEKVVFGTFAAALLPRSNAVAISSEDVFKPFFERSIWHRVQVAQVLGLLGAIPAKEAKAYVEKLNADKKRRDAEWAVKDLEEAAKQLGIKLTRQQQAKVKKQVTGL